MKNKSRRLVVKDNALVNASYNLDLSEQRLILLAIVVARESGQGINTSDPLSVNASSYANQFGVTRQAAYDALRTACLRLKDRKFTFQELTKKGNIHNKITGWVSEVGYVDAEARVTLIFSPALVPMVTELERQFTSYELEQVSSLTSAYAVRLYELLIAWRSTSKTPTFDLADFRTKLGVEPSEYSRMSNFKRFVLDIALKQINDHTDITAQYEQHKRGRSISGFSFTFTQKNPKKTIRKGRQNITKIEAEQKAHVGEIWPDLLTRLTPDFNITDL